MYREDLTSDELQLLLTSTEPAGCHVGAVEVRKSQAAERALEALHEEFAATLQDCLTKMTRREVCARLRSAGRGSFGQFVLCQANPTCCVSLVSKPLDAEYFLAIQPRILYPLIDLLWGATEPEAIPGRPLTEIESQVVTAMVEEVILGYEQTWQPVLSLESRVERLHHHAPQIAMLGVMQEVYLVRYDIRCGSSQGWLELSLPWQATHHMRERLEANYRDAIAARG